MQHLIESVELAHRRKNLPTFRIGDVLRVHGRIREGGKERIQVFEGLVIAMKHGTGLSGTFTVRRIASGIGVERVFPLHSPMIAKIERIRSSKVRRAKLYFLRGRIGKKAKLKGWEAYASWEEKPEEEENQTEASEVETPETAEEIEGSADEQVEEVVVPGAESIPVEAGPVTVESESETTEPAPEVEVSPEEVVNYASTTDNWTDRGESGGEAPADEGVQDSGEKPQE